MTDNNNNNTKIALVTGSSKGLGKNTALALVKKGVNVILTYNSSEAEANSIVSAIEMEERGVKAMQRVGRVSRLEATASRSSRAATGHF
nr:SDR family NAD(P)-dependent oxidoreductase [Pleurocapsa sp. FMAR1]